MTEKRHRTLVRQLLTWYALAVLVVLLTLGVGLNRVLEVQLLDDLTDRVVVAVTFLAMLELVKGRELSVEQETPFGPIVCRSVVQP